MGVPHAHGKGFIPSEDGGRRRIGCRARDVDGRTGYAGRIHPLNARNAAGDASIPGGVRSAA